MKWEEALETHEVAGTKGDGAHRALSRHEVNTSFFPFANVKQKMKANMFHFTCKWLCLLSLSNELSSPLSHLAPPFCKVWFNLFDSVNNHGPHAPRVLLLWWKYWQSHWTGMTKDEGVLPSVSLDINVKTKLELLMPVYYHKSECLLRLSY